MLDELIDAYYKEQPEINGFQGFRHIYVNESLQRVYLSPSGSVLPNKFLFWDYKSLDEDK